MKNNIWYDSFLEALYKKYPQRAQLTDALMNLLSIERDAVYRRLRNEVKFPADEIVRIASTWNISLDRMLGAGPARELSFKAPMLQYLDPEPEHLNTMQRMIDFIDAFSTSPDAEYMEVSNVLPRALIAGFPRLSQYYMFKWMYQYGNEERTLPFSQILPPEKIRSLAIKYGRKMKAIPVVNFIWDYCLFKYLVNDIRYFCSIYLITDAEKQEIREELYSLLDYISEVSSKGYYPETGNQVNLYISQINIDTGYSYFYSDAVKLCRIRVFIKYDILSEDEEMAINFKNWMHLKCRSSIQISGVDEKQRIDFFVKQRQLIDNL
jgi:hypothetical protein